VGSSIYPTESQFRLFLEEAGMTVPLDLRGPLLAGIEAFQEECGRHFLAGKTIENETVAEAERWFDPIERYERVLFLGPFNDLASITSVVHQNLPGGDPETLTLNEHYFPEPANAPARGRPYTRLRRGRWNTWGWSTGGWSWTPTTQSIRITGLWGYATTLPWDVHRAMLIAAAGQSMGQIMAARVQGVISWKDADASVDYGQNPFGVVRQAWMEEYRGTLGKYKLLVA
jgi:hypothetical protein